MRVNYAGKIVGYWHIFFEPRVLWNSFILNGFVSVGLVLMVLVNFYVGLRQIWEVIMKALGEEKRMGSK